MAVTNGTTLITAHDTALTYTSEGSGQGAASNGDLQLDGTACSARRRDNVAYPSGFYWNTGAAWDLSISGTHVLFWFQCITFSLLNNLGFRVGSGTATDYEQHNIGAAAYPDTGGWYPYWVEVGAGTDTGTPDFTNADEFGVMVGMGDVGGNLPNIQTDQTRHSERPVVLLTGSSVSVDDIAAAEIGAGAWYGSVLEVSGQLFCFSNFAIGSSGAATTVSEAVSIVYPDASWLGSGSTWLGVDIDLSNGGTSIDLSGSTLKSSNPAGATARPDLIVTGDSGTFDFSGGKLEGLRVVELNAACTMIGVLFDYCGVVDAASIGTEGAEFTRSTFRNARGASALLWNVNEDVDAKLEDVAFESSGTGHAIEFGTNSPLTLNLTRPTFTGYAVSNGSTGNEAVWVRRTSGTVTINISGGDTPSVRTDGATVVVNNSVTLTFTGIPDGLEARIRKGAVSLAHAQSVTGGTFSYVYEYAAGEKITATFGGVDTGGTAYERLTLTLTLSNANQTIPLDFELDPSYAST